MNNRILLILSTVISVLLLSSCTSVQSERVKPEYKDKTRSGNLQVIGESTYDWGDVSIKGGDVKHIFILRNTAETPLYIKSMFTSCACTKARFKLSDQGISPSYGMHNNASYWAAEIRPNETFEVETTYDPLYHGTKGTGQIRRSINVISSAIDNPIQELVISGNVLSKSDYDKMTEKAVKINDIKKTSGEFDLKEKEYDFGTIKQSGGIVKHNFQFTYNGDTTIRITGTPASCACTVGKISNTEFKKGDQGVLTVEFDPNLHEEPEGRFFKTVSILTEPKLKEMPEVKIWTEIDLDLGKEAFKLQEHDDDEENYKDEI